MPATFVMMINEMDGIFLRKPLGAI